MAEGVENRDFLSGDRSPPVRRKGLAWMLMHRLMRRVLLSTIFRPGTVVTILRGPARGLRYRVFSEYGLAPLFGRWEPEAQRLMEKHICPGSVAYDVGANHGVHTLLMARLAGSSGHVYAFEPVPDIMSQLAENVRLNGFSNVRGLELALGDQTGSASFVRGKDSSLGHLLEPGSGLEGDLSIAVTTLDDFVFVEGHQAPSFVKLDVEGAESRVLSGAERVLRAHHPILLVDLHSPIEDVAVGQILLDLGYMAMRTADGSRVRALDKGWPEPDGLWGQVLAFPARSE